MGTGTGKAGFFCVLFFLRLGKRRGGMRRARICGIMPSFGPESGFMYVISFNLHRKPCELWFAILFRSGGGARTEG